MPSTRSGASYDPSSTSQKGHRRDYGRRQSVTEGQGLPDPCRSVEKLHELLPDFEKIPGPSQHLQVTQWLVSIDRKKNMMLLKAEWRENNPAPHKQVPKTAPVASSSNSNMKRQPQAQNKGKGKALATKPYSQGYRMLWKM
ncbi:hypothetical protein O181_121421 [Austropuccinia psidii MF-1]|uniref:Uncharacterized protein n=1 Tax=Austropuccinia psidii MF-1 TaxID=1389203 RepID=A0A9Q3Q1G4_9BASI|nr:hypothetical protein [Austropuccinia psidii MF-1]